MRSETVQIRIKFYELKAPPPYIQLALIQPRLVDGTHLDYVLEQEEKLQIQLRGIDPDGSYDDQFDMDINLQQIHYFTNKTRDKFDPHLFYLTFEPTTSTPPTTYKFFVLFKNSTLGNVLSKEWLSLTVKPLSPKPQVYQQRIQNFTEDQLAVQDTEFKVSKVTRAGLVEISFSNQLRVPVDDQGYFNFD